MVYHHAPICSPLKFPTHPNLILLLIWSYLYPIIFHYVSPSCIHKMVGSASIVHSMVPKKRSTSISIIFNQYFPKWHLLRSCFHHHPMNMFPLCPGFYWALLYPKHHRSPHSGSAPHHGCCSRLLRRTPGVRCLKMFSGSPGSLPKPGGFVSGP